jgi:TRAP-type C4-dicarboxylate transport system permease small subunit
MTRLIGLPIRWLAMLLAGIAGVALVLMMLQTVANVVMSNVFGRPIAGNIEIVSVYHMVLVVFLPLAFVELRHEHISVELVVQLFPAWLRRLVLCFSYLVATGFFCILARQTWFDAMRSFRINEIMMGSIYVTIWPAKFALPVGFAAVALAVFWHAWRAASDPGFEPSPESAEDGPA